MAKVLTVSQIDSKDEWIMDSGCTFHMTLKRDWLIDYKSLDEALCSWGTTTHVELLVSVLLCLECGMALPRNSRMLDCHAPKQELVMWRLV
ncbi:hypothetical protein L484_012398 [Morus notabilis]|uniref:Retrovirus-related Pol polyprotein from transposon TNT 1-94-like beta-barrel domain-containing protein n=1 Tax=Morus notabilis TaxID=981085 RepID=W9QZZ9_9ROSA|nr:hypothetical protein L484_012398 [Morus notabilis]